MDEPHCSHQPPTKSPPLSHLRADRIARNTPWLPQRALEFTDHLMDEAFDTPAEKLEPIQMAFKTFPICGQILELGADMVRTGAVDPEQVSDAIFELASIHAPE